MSESLAILLLTDSCEALARSTTLASIVLPAARVRSLCAKAASPQFDTRCSVATVAAFATDPTASRFPQSDTRCSVATVDTFATDPTAR